MLIQRHKNTQFNHSILFGHEIIFIIQDSIDTAETMSTQTPQDNPGHTIPEPPSHSLSPCDKGRA